MNIIVDYGLGNLGSVSRGFARALKEGSEIISKEVSSSKGVL